MSREELWSVLNEVLDPEVPVISIVELGIVRDVASSDDTVTVTVTPTYPGCPAMNAIEREIAMALKSRGVEQVELKTVYSPAWTTDWIIERGHERLKAYGIAPPNPSTVAECPKCGSMETEEVSRFGSTPCKAQWRCKACLEPFDRFKCH